ncbi:hypothetical protein NPIL_311501 [Nephila pilipes]|uniref:Uncharacterized protein n=1 Tax=Nephila pilipes TaxID=299642 RepID=A0A8X6TTP5_NEPPI|nr:hypothetical protein NPIL_311501 [Nephila pilipes]
MKEQQSKIPSVWNRARERSVFLKRRVCGLSYKVRSYLAGIQDVVFRRRPTLFFSLSSSFFFSNRRSFKVGTTVGDGNALNNRRDVSGKPHHLRDPRATFEPSGDWRLEEFLTGSVARAGLLFLTSRLGQRS